MKEYQQLQEDVLENGDHQVNRTGTDTISVLSREMRIDVSECFALLTSKKMATKTIIGEDLWFLSGSSDILELRKLSELSPTQFCIWQKNLDEYNVRIGKPNNTDLGYVYGKVWRKNHAFNGHIVDQIANVVDNINAVKENPSHPMKNRLIVNTWDAFAHGDAKGLHAALPPCHYGFQFFVRGDKLSIKWHQRSVDTFLGLPFNIASYCFILYTIAKITGLKPHLLMFTGGDVHIYEDHIEQCKEQLSRPTHELPQLILPDDLTLEKLTNQEYTASDFKIVNYTSEPPIKGLMS